jgi:CubicO group peptidase (beta-lactamase class C family)
MLRWSAVVTTVFLCTATPGLAGDLHADLSAALKSTKAPAAGVLVMRNGKVESVAVEGLRRNDQPDRVQPDDLWRVGSVAKPMTATLIAKLVDRGTLDWKAPLAKMLPNLAATMRPEYRTLTLVQLLSHQSGLPHDLSEMKFLESLSRDKRPLTAQRLDMIARALRDKPVAPPGTKFGYSNTGFVIAAVIAERATGVSYEELMRREVFAPLGITRESITDPEGAGLRGHKDGKPVLDTAEVFPLAYAPAGDWYLSLGDWAKFCLDQMAGAHGHGRLLKTATYRFMQTPHVVDGDDKVGLDWGIDDTAMGYTGPFLEHTGTDETWYAELLLISAKESGVLAVSNAGESMGGKKASGMALKAALPEIASPVPASAKP